MENINLNFICVGKTFEHFIESISNPSVNLITNVFVELNYDDSVIQYVSSSLPKGVYDPLTRRWSVGSLAAKQEIKGASFIFRVLNDCEFPVKIENYIDAIDCINESQSYKTYSAVTCCDIAKCTTTSSITSSSSV